MPKIYLGNNKTKKIWLGNTQIKKVWLGNNLVFSSGTEVADLSFAYTRNGSTYCARTSQNNWTGDSSYTQLAGVINADAWFGYIAKWGSETYVGGNFTNPYIKVYIVIDGTEYQIGAKTFETFSVNNSSVTTGRDYSIENLEYSLSLTGKNVTSSSTIQGKIVIGSARGDADGQHNSFRDNRILATSTVSGILS